MSDWLNTSRSSDHRGITIPTIWVALALSLLVHLAVLLVWLPRVHLPSLENPERDNASGPLVVELAPESKRATSPPPSPPSSPPPRAQPLSSPRPAPAPAVPRPPSTAPVIALSPAPVRAAPPAPPVMVAPASPIAVPLAAPPPVTAPAPAPASLPGPSLAPAPATVVPPPRTVAEPAIAAPPRTVPAPAPATPASPPPVQGDLSSYIEARRRARGQATDVPPQEAPRPSASLSAAQLEDEKERSNRIIAANLGLNRTPTVGYDPKGGGGIFQIQRMGRDSAEFIFFGWNKDIRRNSKQLIEVSRGDSSDIRIAVVRKMIAIIRENEPGDFVWVSQRLGRNVTLSARPGDNAELEDFITQEFFTDPRRLN